MADCGVPGERPARGHEFLLFASAEGFHQGHQHPAPLPEDEHAAGSPDGQGAARPHRDPQGEAVEQGRWGLINKTSS